MLFLKKNKYKKVYFVCNAKYRGTHLLRGTQVAKALRKFGINAKVIRSRNLNNVFDAIVIFVKEITKDQVVLAKENRNFVMFDILDGYNKNIDFLKESKMCDIVISPSIMAQKFIRNKVNEKTDVSVIYHHIDTRLFGYAKISKQSEKFCIGYIGNLPDKTNNVIHATDKKFGIKLLETNTNKANRTNWMKQAGIFNCHYNVRPDGIQVIAKPLAKVAVASVYNSNIIINDKSPAMELLGKDYPYYTASDFKSVSEMIEYARESFGSNIWKSGLDIMKSVKEKLTLENMVEDYINLISC